MYGEYNLSAYDYVLIIMVVVVPVGLLLLHCWREAKADAQIPPMTKAQYDAWVLKTYPECNNAFPVYMEDERMEGIYPPVHYDGVWPGQGRCGCKDCVDAWHNSNDAVNYNEQPDPWEYEIGVGLDGDDFIFEEIKYLNENRIIWRTGHMSAYLALVKEDNIYPFNRLLGDMRGDATSWLYRNEPTLAVWALDEPF